MSPEFKKVLKLALELKAARELIGSACTMEEAFDLVCKAVKVKITVEKVLGEHA